MKTISRLKKVVALGMGLTMVGATLFGASAVKLSDWPSPFVMNGMPASNLAVVFGDLAVASDVAGATEVVAALQQAAVVKTQVPGAVSKVSLKGNAVEIGSPTNLLEINETLGAVRNTFTEFDLPLLKGSTMSTQSGVTKVNQYLQFPGSGSNTAYRSNKVVFDEDEFRNVGTFLFVNDGDELTVWTLEFEEGLKSQLSEKTAGDFAATAGGQLDELTNRRVNILGTEYVVTKTEVHGSQSNNQTVITLLGGKVTDKLGEGDKKTYTVNGKEYNVEVLIVSESNNEVLLKVNGEALPKLRVGETEPTSDGLLVGLIALYPTAKDTQSSIIELAIGTTKLVFKDNVWDAAKGVSDNNVYTRGGLTVNNEVIEDDAVRINLNPIGDSNSSWVLSDIKVNITANGLVGDIFVPPGHGVREYLNEPTALLAPGWDVKYEGLMNTGTTTVRITPTARDEYKLEFVNQEGLKYSVPLASQRQTSGTLRRGEYTGGRQRDLIYFEANGTLELAENTRASHGNVNRFDYFVVSDIDQANTIGLQNLDSGAPTVFASWGASQTDNTGFTHVLKYEEFSSGQRVATFTDLASGTKQVTVAPGQNLGNLVIGGTTYQFEVVGGVNNAATDNANISVDVDGDGRLSRLGRAAIATEGGLLVTLPVFNNSAGLGGNAAVQGTGLLSNQLPVLFTTLAKQFDSGGTTHLFEGVRINATSAAIRLERQQMQNLTFKFLTSEPEIAQYLDAYGAQWELFDPLTTDSPEELTLEYPLSQRGAQVFLTSGDVTKEQSKGGESQKMNPLPVGISKLASQVSDLAKLNAIVVGGPCANPAAAKLLGNPEPCTKGFEKGKATLRLFEHATGNVALLVAGYAGDDTWRAARVLATGTDLKNSKADKEAVVSGSTLSDVTVKAA